MRRPEMYVVDSGDPSEVWLQRAVLWFAARSDVLAHINIHLAK